MINKLVDQLSTDLVDFFKIYGIEITAQYTPELPGLLTYSRNFLSRTLDRNPVSIDGSLYQNKILYRVSAIKPAEFAPHNNRLAIMAGIEDVGQAYTLVRDSLGESKIRIQTDDGTYKVRDVTIAEIPMEFTIITESLELIHSATLLFYQRLVHMNVLSLQLDLVGSQMKTSLDYFMNWDRDSLEISYANFENTNALNTITFSMKVSGPLFSEFYIEDQVINRYDLAVGFINQSTR